MKMTEKQQRAAMEFAMKLGVERGVTERSDDARGNERYLFVRKSSHRALSFSNESALSQIHAEGLLPEYERALEQMRPAFERAGERAGRAADTKKQTEALLDAAYREACQGHISQSTLDQFAARKLLKAQAQRWTGIQALAPRAAAENAQREAQKQRAAAEREIVWARERVERDAARAAEREEEAQRRAQIALTRVQMRLDLAPAAGASFRHRDGRVLVCTGHSKNPWTLSQREIDDNDDFELEGVYLTYVYFRLATDEEAAAFQAAEMTLQEAAAQAQIHAQSLQAAMKTVMAHARAGSLENTDVRPNLSGATMLHERPRDYMWGGGCEMLAASETEIVYVYGRSERGDWMDSQKLYQERRATLADAPDDVKSALDVLRDNVN